MGAPEREVSGDWGLRWCVGALGAVALAYALTAAGHLTGTDNPEFVMLQRLGGVAHSPGYPAYVFFLRMTSWMPGSSAAHAAALSTALLGAGCVAALWRAARAWGASRAGATVAALATGLNTQVWHVHTHAEAFAFNDLCVALLLWWCAPQGPLRGVARVAALGLLAGVALGNHHTAALIAPLGLWAVWRGAKEAGSRWWLGLGLGAAGLALGLCSYAYLLVVDPWSQWVWGAFDGWSAVRDHFLRVEYGTGKLGPGGGPDPLTHVPHLLGGLLLNGLLVGPLLAAWGAREVLTAEGDGGAERSGWRALVATWVLCGLVFVGLFNMDPVGPLEVVVARFHVMPAVVLGPWIARGWDAAWGAVAPGRDRVVVALGLGVCAAAAVGLGVTRTRAHYSDAIEVYARGVMESAPQRAVVLGTGTSRYLAHEYMQRVEGLREDVVVLEAHMLGRGWFVARAEERLGLELPRPDEVDGVKKVPVVEIIEVLLASGRPVLLTDRFTPKLAAAFTLEPAPMGWVVRPEGAAAPSAAALGATARAALELAAPDPMPTYEAHPWGWVLYRELGRLWEDAAARCGGAPECAEPIRRAAARFTAPD
jgi:hypothetical protein